MKLSTPRRLGIILISTKLSDLLLSAKTSLPVLLNAAGAPVWMAQTLVPIRESGALLPQMIYAYLLRNKTRRDSVWMLSMFIQFVSACALLATGLLLEGVTAGVCIMLSLAIMSLARALSSVTMKDIQGKHINKGERGKLIGSASTISSFITIAVALIALLGSSKISTDKLLVFGLIALATQLVCMYLMRPLKTLVDVEEREVSSGLYIDKSLLKFVAVRSLLAHTALIAPIIVLSYDGDFAKSLSFFVIAQAAASFVSSYIWGVVADKSALWCMRGGILVGILASLVLLVGVSTQLVSYENTMFMVAVFFVINVGHSGVRTGRKIYGVDIAVEQHRTEFIASTNTLVGIAILLLGAFYSFVSAYSSELTFSIMVAGMLAGLFGSFALKSEK